MSHQTQNNRTVALIIGIVLMLMSIPSEWMTIHNAKMKFDGFPSNSSLGSSFPGGMTMKVTGVNGSIDLGIKLSIWIVVIIGILALGLTLLNGRNITDIPFIGILIPLLFSCCYTVAGILVPIFSSEASIGVGGIMAFAGLAIGIYATIKSKGEQADAGNRAKPGA